MIKVTTIEVVPNQHYRARTKRRPPDPIDTIKKLEKQIDRE